MKQKTHFNAFKLSLLTHNTNIADQHIHYLHLTTDSIKHSKPKYINLPFKEKCCVDVKATACI